MMDRSILKLKKQKLNDWPFPTASKIIEEMFHFSSSFERVTTRESVNTSLKPEDLAEILLSLENKTQEYLTKSEDKTDSLLLGITKSRILFGRRFFYLEQLF